MDEELKAIVQAVVSDISKRSCMHRNEFSGDEWLAVEIDENLNALLDKLDKLSQ